MEIKTIDINCDVGEGIENEPELFPLISSCNIACGGHAGNEKSIKKTAILAKKHRVKVGAHPSYPDRKNFGRIIVDMPKIRLRKSIQEQIKTFEEVVSKEDIKLHHIKPHGALYNIIAKDLKIAEVFLDAIHEYKEYVLYVPYNSVIERAAKSRGFKIKYEAFCDRNYNNDLTLVSRNNDNAIITKPEHVLQHVLYMVKDRSVKTISGELKNILADTFCIHGDSLNAIEILMYLSNELPKHNIQIYK